MKNLLRASFAILFMSIALIQVPMRANANYEPESILSIQKQQEIMLDKTTLAKLCDSLVLENNYKKIIKICEAYSSDSNYKETVFPYLIAAYYFTADSIKSRKILTTSLNSKSYEDIIFYLIGNNVALIKYFEINKNREHVVAIALKNYRDTVKASHKQEGEQVIRFIINDQMVRKLNYAYKKEKPEVLEELKHRQRIADSIQNENIYRFYKKHGHFFSEKEIGKNISSMQLLFFSHITDIELRQSFFKPILEKAVKEGVIDKESLVNFILRTESFTNPEFWNTINDRLPEIRKQYNLSENYFFNPF